MTEIRQDRFCRVATNRTVKILQALKSLSKCSEKKNYCYNKEQIKWMFSLIEQTTEEIKSAFESGQSNVSRENLNSKLQSLNKRRRE
jgi:ribosome biogenesis protein Nip4